jgi:hypothetical protein
MVGGVLLASDRIGGGIDLLVDGVEQVIEDVCLRAYLVGKAYTRSNTVESMVIAGFVPGMLVRKWQMCSLFAGAVVANIRGR